MTGIEIELDPSSLHLSAHIASLVPKGILLTPSIPLDAKWIGTKKRSPRPPGPTLHAQKLNSDQVVCAFSKNSQEALRRIAKKGGKMELDESSLPLLEIDPSSLHLSADIASRVPKGTLLTPSIPLDAKWIGMKKRSPRPPGPTLHAQKLNSDQLVCAFNKSNQEALRRIAKKDGKMKLDESSLPLLELNPSSLHLSADIASLVPKGTLLTPPIPLDAKWIGTKKGSTRSPGPTLHAQKSYSNQVVCAFNKNNQEALRRIAKKDGKMELDESSLPLLANAASWVSEVNLTPTPSIFTREDEKKVTVLTTTCGPYGVKWIGRRPRGATLHAQTLNSDQVVNVVDKNNQEYLKSASKKDGKMELDVSSLFLLANTVSLVSEGTMSISARDDEMKVTVSNTSFGPIGVKWVGMKKRSPRSRGLTLHAQKSNSDQVLGVIKRTASTLDSTKIQEIGRASKRPKKTKKTDPAALIGPSKLPTIFMNKVEEFCGRDVTLVVEKKLYDSDMKQDQSRLSIPKLQIRADFLTYNETQILDTKKGVKVSLIEPCLEVNHGLQLKRWNYTSKTFSYVLTGRWNEVAHPYERNKLAKDDIIQLWSFRVEGNLCFCLLKV